MPTKDKDKTEAPSAPVPTKGDPGRKATLISFSIPIRAVRKMDEACEKRGIAYSAFVEQAILHEAERDA